MKLYIAGKVSKESSFGTHHWRDNFCAKLAELSGLALEHVDPLEAWDSQAEPRTIFAENCRQISRADLMVAYLSDDISVGGSQEILIARYLGKSVIGLAPHGGKFNGARREMFGRTIENYKDPFVFSTCDVVCGTIEEVAEALKTADSLPRTGLGFIDQVVSAE